MRGGDCVVGWLCGCCVDEYVRSAVFFFGYVSSWVGGLWLSGTFCLFDEM